MMLRRDDSPVGASFSENGVRESMLEQLVGGRTNELNILSLVVVRACLNVKQNWLPLSS